jgi:hypothetical protein
MTHEMFFVIAEHFISYLPANLGPVIFLLDGHGSRWLLPALQLLMKHNVHPFLHFKSHINLAQLDVAGVNKGFHRASKQSHRTAGIATVAHFNELFVRGSQICLEAERGELRAMRFNPFATPRTEAIKTLGMGVITSEK